MDDTPREPGGELDEDNAAAISEILERVTETYSLANDENFREQLTTLTADEKAKLLDSLRGVSTDLAKIVDTLRASNLVESVDDKDAFKTTPGLLEQPRPKQTAHALHRAEQAIADYKSATPNRTGDALVHRVTDKDGDADPIEVLFSPIDSRFFPPNTTRFSSPPTLPDLMKKLEKIGSSGPLIFAVIISLAAAEDRPQINLNDLLAEVGLVPRSRAQRKEYIALLWECFQVAAQTLVYGQIKGKYRDKKGKPLDHISMSPVIALTGVKYPAEMRLDGSETPAAVEYTFGSFFYEQRGNKQFLAYLGDVRMLNTIPHGRPAGQWAVSIGLALLQHWREAATRTDKRTTRQELFQMVLPDPNPFVMLEGKDPMHVRKLYNVAIRWLVDVKFLAPPPEEKTYPRQGWQKAWLAEPLDYRPHSTGNAITVNSLAAIAESDKARRRRAPRRKKHPQTR